MLHLRVLVPGQDDISDALLVRRSVFMKEEKLCTGPDEDAYDRLHSTKHLVVYDDWRPVATARLLFCNSEVARATGGLCGVALDQQLDLSPIVASGLRLAESGRVAVLSKYRKSEVIWRLLAGIYSVSRSNGAKVWVAAVNAETDDSTDVWIMTQVVRARHLKGPWRIRARAPSSPPANPSKVFYKEGHRALAREKKFNQLPLPHVLALFTRKMGARVMGSPLYLPEFSRWAFPISALLRQVPRKTRERFKALTSPTSPQPTANGAGTGPGLEKHMQMSQQPDWIDELVQIARKLVRTLDRRLVSRSLFEGTITRGHYIDWGKQTVLYVRQTPLNLGKSGRRLKRWGRKHAPIAELLLTKEKEEQFHDQWMASDLINLGCSQEEIDGTVPYPAVELYMATHRFQAEGGSPYFILGTGLVLEFVSEHRASMAAENLVARSEIPGIAGSTSFITRHGRLDGGHVEEALTLLRGITCPRAQAAILAGARHTALVLPGFFPKPEGRPERKVA